MTVGTRHRWSCVLLAPALLLACEAGSVLVGRTAGGGLDPILHPDDPPPAPGGDADADADMDPEPPIDCDRDDDGWDSPLCGGEDCDDEDPETHPEAIEAEEWAVEVVAENATWPAIAIDVQGAAHLVMRAAVSGGTALRYVTNRSGEWVSEDIAELGEGLGAPSIVAGVDRRLHVCWATTDLSTTTVVYAGSVGATWRAVPILSSAGDPVACAIAVDLRGVVHVAAQDPRTSVLQHAKLYDGIWTTVMVDDAASVGTLPSMLVDFQYVPSIGYRDGADGALRFAAPSPTGWRLETIAEAGLSSGESVPDFALGPNGSVHASYRDTHIKSAHYASEVDGVWETRALESSGYSGKSSSIVVDGNGASHVAYSWDDHLDRPDDLVFRTDAGGPWSNAQMIDDEGATGFAPQLAVGTHTLHVVYFRVGVADHPEVLHARRALPDAVDRDCDGEM